MPAETKTVDVPGLSSGDLFDDRAGSGANRLPYHGLVEQLVRLVVEVKPPVNIALFGPWGAGKSTVGNLLEAALRERGEQDRPAPIRFARYDAWRYAGVSLYRSFISETAHQLVGSRSAERYSRLLYQKWSGAGFRLSTLLRSLPAVAVTFAIVLVAATAILALLAGLASTATGEDFFGEIKRQLRTVLPVSGVVALLTAAARPFFDAAGFKVEQEAPDSAEQFRETLARLVDEALSRGGGTGLLGKRRSIDEAARVVFFIDELDRCSPQDVVEALRAIKTFLEAERCVFVVAADRDVLEADFEQLPQENPVNEEAPYFSSAGSFLDKVFQYQIPLPPLRGRRLTRFARDLVQERVEQRRGLWFELSGERQGRLLDDVVYALVPSHVRSPRRVKVLLNRFATNARIAQAHGIDPLVRAEEIAKLTVLQLEFPMLAADLRSEPRLPALLLDPPDAPPPPLAALLERYDLRAADGDSRLPEQTRPTARLLSGSERPAVLRTQHVDLLRYLQRTSEIADPAPDLVYLEAGGKAFDVEDPSLAEEVERLAPDTPDDLLDILRARSAGERLAAARILLELSETAVGREQRNVLTVLLKTLDGLGEDAMLLADRAAQAMRAYLRRQTLPYELLGAALAISESQQVRSPAELTNALLAMGPAWSDPGRAQRVCELADTLEQAQLEAVAPRVAEAFLLRPSILTDALRRPLSEGVQKLFALRELTDAIDQRLADPGVGALGGLALAQELHEAGRPQMGTELVSRTAEPMLRHLESEDAYRVIRSWAERAAFDGTAPGAEAFVLQALRRAPPDDWDFWIRRLRDPSAPTAEHAELAFAALGRIFATFRTLDAAHQDAAAEAVYGLGRFLRGFEDPETPWLVVGEFEAAAAADWWRDEAGRATQRRLHALIFRLADSVPEVASRDSFTEEIERWLAGGLRAALEAGAGDDPDALAEIRRLASDMSPAAAQPILELVGAAGAVVRDEKDRVVPEPASSEVDAVWSQHNRGWKRALAAIGADQETLVAVRAFLAAARSDEQRKRIAERLAILERPEPPDARETAELAMWLAGELGESGEGLARSLLSVHPRELRDVLEALRARGLAVSPALAAAIGDAAGHLGPKSWSGTRASTGLHLTLTPKNGARTETVETDVAIVGSGAAGSTLAYRLAQEERDVMVLERGPLVDPSLGRVRVLRQALEHAPRDAGLDVVQGVCIGGPTLASAGVAASPSEDIVRRWERMGMDTAALRRSIGDARRQLIDATRDGGTVPDRSLASALEASAAGQETGDVRYTAVALDGREPRAMSTLHSVLPEAQKRFGVDRVRVLSDCRVERIEHRAERATSARCRLADGRRLDVRADTFVVAAGVPASCELLLDSDLGDLPIGQGVSCNASCLLLAEFSRGRSLAPPGSVAYAELADHGVTLEWRLDGPDRGVAGMPGWFEDVATGRRGGEHWVGVVVTTGLGPGAISRPPARLELMPDRDDIARLVDGLKLAARSAFALGARRVMPAAARPQDVREAEDLDRLDRFISEPRSLVLGTTQPLGGNRIGWDPEAGVVGDDFRVRGLGNVYVCDASVLPTSTTVYPQLTIMALASQAAGAIASGA